MAKVKIISVPPGGAPLDIREQWVGLALPLIEGELPPGVLRGVTGDKPNPRSMNGWPVETEKAIQALRDKDLEEAAEWWEKWYLETRGTGHTLMFARDCGELVDESADTGETPMHRVAAMTAANKRA
jgi:hypothetical protein